MSIKAQITILSVVICLTVLSLWACLEAHLFVQWCTHQSSFLGFFGYSMGTFSVISWLVISTPYFVSRPYRSQFKTFPSYWDYINGKY